MPALPVASDLDPLTGALPREASFGRRFLQQPDLFPGRASGEFWGRCELTLAMPGCPLRIFGLAEAQAAALAEHFASAVQPGGKGSPTRLQVFRAPLSDFHPAEIQVYDLDLDYRQESVRVAGWHLMGRLEWSDGLSAALWTPHACGSTLIAACENLARVLLGYRLLDDGGVLVHSAAVGGADSAFLFAGHSGAGKTTISSLLGSEGATVLGDDLNALLWVGSSLVVSSTPFSGEAELRRRPLVRRPLARILFLRQGATVSQRPLSSCEAVGRLLSSTPFVNLDPYRRHRLLDTLESICRDVSAAELTFARRRGLWRWLRASW